MSIRNFLSTLQFITSHPLNRRERTKAIRRFLAWQIGSRLLPGPVVFEFVAPAFLYALPGMTGATGNLYAGLQEFEEMSFVLHALRHGDLFVDVGANIGAYTILASRVVGADCVSFEPVEDTYNWLLRNIQLNGVSDKVKAVRAAIGGSVGTAAMTIGLDTTNHVIESEHATIGVNAAVEMTTLDAILGDRAPAFVKIDAEGLEGAVIEGAMNTLSRTQCRGLIVEIHGTGARYGLDDSELISRLTTLGFEPINYLPFERRLVPRPEFKLGNVIFVRDRGAVEQRLREGPSFRCHGLDV